MGNSQSNCVQGRQTLTRAELDELCKPSGLYESCSWEAKTVRKLIKQRKLAGRLSGKDDRITGLEQQCPICLLHYDEINTINCCKATICTECYLQAQNPRERDASCPFCKHPVMTVSIAKRLDGGDAQKREKEEQRVIEATIRQRNANDRGSNSSGGGGGGSGSNSRINSGRRSNSAGGNTSASTPTRGTTPSSSSSSPTRSEMWNLHGRDQVNRNSHTNSNSNSNINDNDDNLQATLEDLYLLEITSTTFANNSNIDIDSGGNDYSNGNGNGNDRRGHERDHDRDYHQDYVDDNDRGVGDVGTGLSTAATELYAGLSEENQLELAIQLSLQEMAGQ